MDTLRASLPMKWIVVLQNVMWVIYLATIASHVKIALLAQNYFGLASHRAENFVFFLQISSTACAIFLTSLTTPYVMSKHAQKRRDREYSRQQKVTEEHEKILERWKHEVKPEGETQN